VVDARTAQCGKHWNCMVAAKITETPNTGCGQNEKKPQNKNTTTTTKKN